MARAGTFDRAEKPVLLECEPGEPIVAAIPVLELPRQRHAFEVVTAADPCREWVLSKVVGSQAAAPAGQRSEVRHESVAERRGDRKGIDREGCHVPRRVMLGARDPASGSFGRHQGDRWLSTCAASALKDAKIRRFSSSSARICTP